MFWDNKYKKEKRLWGKKPSELGVLTVQYLKKSNLDNKNLEILDIGCGYGRDVFYISENVKCKILGIDSSNEAIILAKNFDYKDRKGKIIFRQCDFKDLDETKYEVIFVSNLFQILKKKERNALRNTILRVLKANGLIFLSTLSVNDPEHYCKGTPISGEPNSYVIGTYVHFCTEHELERDFNFLDIQNLYEHEYYEPRVTGKAHHHISWILIGKNKIN
ncbi:MAG: class I SAM-dependent methyltransferase [Candidatus Helarchaeota archaeon]|nr:class I SAM-dependent methyltransferase [Candidatus Helarchaeota archaeon]